MEPTTSIKIKNADIAVKMVIPDFIDAMKKVCGKKDLPTTFNGDALILGPLEEDLAALLMNRIKEIKIVCSLEIENHKNQKGNLVLKNIADEKNRTIYIAPVLETEPTLRTRLNHFGAVESIFIAKNNSYAIATFKNEKDSKALLSVLNYYFVNEKFVKVAPCAPAAPLYRAQILKVPKSFTEHDFRGILRILNAYSWKIIDTQHR